PERIAHRVETDHPHRPRCHIGQAQQHQDRRGLAGAIGAENAEHLARLDAEIELLDGGETGIPLRQPFRPDDRLRHRRPYRIMASTRTSTAAAMTATPTAPQMVEVWTVMRKSEESETDSPFARSVTM